MLALRYSERAINQLTELKARAEKSPNSGHEKVYVGIKKVITDLIGSPEHAFHMKTLLGHRLGGVRRVKFTRYRVFYVASKEVKTSIVLFIGFRKDGDKDDAYEDIEKLLKSGEFNHLFDDLRLTRPSICPSLGKSVRINVPTREEVDEKSRPSEALSNDAGGIDPSPAQ